MPNVCGLCTRRVSDWEMACGKTVVINGQIVHKACLMDVKPSEVKKEA